MDERHEPFSQTEETQPNRRIFGAIFVLGAAALVLGGMQILNTIRSPFRSIDSSSNISTVSAQVNELSSRDTDGDSVNDFDELYVYQTSPYLADSDSDGIDDATEIGAGTNPNCPTGQNCSAIAVTDPGLSNTNGANSNVNAAQLEGTSLSADELRVALRNAGAPAATLEGLGDAELLELYEEVTGTSVTPAPSNTNGSTNGSSASTNSTGSADLDTLENLSSEQIREFLRAGGADEETLNSVDDETLRAIFQQALDDLNQN